MTYSKALQDTISKSSDTLEEVTTAITTASKKTIDFGRYKSFTATFKVGRKKHHALMLDTQTNTIHLNTEIIGSVVIS